MTVVEKLVDSHKNSRSHLMKLLEGLTEEQFEEKSGNWSIQKACVHILNAELFWQNNSDGKDREYLPWETSLASFKLKQDKFAISFRTEVKNAGLELNYLKDFENKKYSMHFAMSRTIQHAIYHIGMISVLRHNVGAPRLENIRNSWSMMVDSVFEAHL